MLVTEVAATRTDGTLPIFLVVVVLVVAVATFVVRDRQRSGRTRRRIMAGSDLRPHPPRPRPLESGRPSPVDRGRVRPRGPRAKALPEARLGGEVLLYGPWFTTLCHGVCGPAEKNLTVRAATVRGLRHRYEGTPGQDALGMVWNPERSSLFVVIADGLGSQRDSGEAARRAVSRALGAAGRLAAQGDPVSILTEARHAVEVFNESEGHGTSTMAVSEIRRARTETQVETWGIGDSEAWLLSAGRWNALHHERGPGRENVTRHLPYDKARRNQCQVPAGSVLVLATDGFASALGPHSPLGARLSESWREPPAPVDFLGHVDFDDNKFTDDRAAVAVWIR